MFGGRGLARPEWQSVDALPAEAVETEDALPINLSGDGGLIEVAYSEVDGDWLNALASCACNARVVFRPRGWQGVTGR